MKMSEASRVWFPSKGCDQRLAARPGAVGVPDQITCPARSARTQHELPLCTRHRIKMEVTRIQNPARKQVVKGMELHQNPILATGEIKDHIPRPVKAGKTETVGILPAAQGIDASPTDQGVCPTATKKPVVAAAAGQKVVATPATASVLPLTAKEEIRVVAKLRRIAHRPAIKRPMLEIGQMRAVIVDPGGAGHIQGQGRVALPLDKQQTVLAAAAIEEILGTGVVGDEVVPRPRPMRRLPPPPRSMRSASAPPRT